MIFKRSFLGTLSGSLFLLLGSVFCGGCTAHEDSPAPAAERLDVHGDAFPAAHDSEKRRAIVNLRVSNYFASGESVQYAKGVPQRIVVVGSGEIETLLAFGAADRILAAESWYPLENFLRPEYRPLVKQLPLVPYGQISLEYLMFLEPDLLVAQQCMFTDKRFISTDFWNRRGVLTFVPWNTNDPGGHAHHETIESEMKFLYGLGQLLHEEERAARMIDGVYRTLADIQERCAPYHKPKALVIEFMGKEIASYDVTKLAGDMVTRLGGEIPETAPLIDRETLLAINPEVLFIVCYGEEDARQVVARVLNDRALNSLEVVRTGRICPLLLEYVYSSEVRTEDALKIIGHALYPDLKGLSAPRGF